MQERSSPPVGTSVGAAHPEARGGACDGKCRQTHTTREAEAEGETDPETHGFDNNIKSIHL